MPLSRVTSVLLAAAVLVPATAGPGAASAVAVGPTGALRSVGPGFALPAAAVPAGAPAVVAAAAAPAWKPAWSDDFSGSTLGSVWGRYGGPHGGEAASAYDPAQVSVSGGMLRLGIARKDRLGRPYSTGGVGSNPQAQLYGKFEFRAKAPPGAGIDSYATLWPEGDAGDADFTGVELLARPGNQRAYLSNKVAGVHRGTEVVGGWADSFHVFSVEWAPRWFRVTVDGRSAYADQRASTVRKWIGFAVSSGDPLTGLPDSATRLPAVFLVDWVRVWTYAGPASGAPAPTSARSGSPRPPAKKAPAATSARPSPTPAPTRRVPATLSPTAPPSIAAVPVSRQDPGGPPLLALSLAAFAGSAGLVAALLLTRRRPGRHGR